MEYIFCVFVVLIFLFKWLDFQWEYNTSYGYIDITDIATKISEIQGFSLIGLAQESFSPLAEVEEELIILQREVNLMSILPAHKAAALASLTGHGG